MRAFYFILIVFAPFILSKPLLAAEKLGTLSIEDILLRPSFTVVEGQDAEFSLGETSFALSWFKNQNLGGIVRMGPQYLLSPMLHFVDEVEKSWTIVEAFGQVSGIYGRLRMGLIPVEFGIEGQWQESELIFSRSLVFKNRLLSLRDYGLSYHVSNNGYYTRMAVHNGESESRNKDGRMFFTASWGWKNSKNLNVGVSAMTGTTKPESTTGVTKDFVAEFNPNKKALWRMGEIYFHWYPNNWFFLSEILFGEKDQEKETVKFNSGHIDLGYSWSDYLKTYVRYDHFDPNDQSNKDLERRLSMALAFSDKYNINTVFFIVTKVYEQGIKVNNDEAQVVWRLTPNIL